MFTAIRRKPLVTRTRKFSKDWPETHFWLFLGTNVQIVKLRGKDDPIVFRHFQAMPGVSSFDCLCMSAVCVLNTLALSISIIQEIGLNIEKIVEIFCTMIASPIEVANNTVIIKDAN